MSTDDMPAPGRVDAARNAGRRALRVGKYAVGHSEWSLPVLLRLTPEGTERAIDDDTDIVVEGFPRSGNTFTAFAFRYLAPEPIHVSTHIHHPGLVKRAIRRRLPVVVVVRPPVDTLASYLIAGPHATPSMVFREYRYYHRQILRLAENLVVATFEQVTNDISTVVDRVNNRFETSFVSRPLTLSDRDRIFELVEQHSERHHPGSSAIMPRPEPGRSQANRRLRLELMADRYAVIRIQCEDVYQRLAARAG